MDGALYVAGHTHYCEQHRRLARAEPAASTSSRPRSRVTADAGSWAPTTCGNCELRRAAGARAAGTGSRHERRHLHRPVPGRLERHRQRPVRRLRRRVPAGEQQRRSRAWSASRCRHRPEQGRPDCTTTCAPTRRVAVGRHRPGHLAGDCDNDNEYLTYRVIRRRPGPAAGLRDATVSVHVLERARPMGSSSGASTPGARTATGSTPATRSATRPRLGAHGDRHGRRRRRRRRTPTACSPTAPTPPLAAGRAGGRDRGYDQAGFNDLTWHRGHPRRGGAHRRRRRHRHAPSTARRRPRRDAAAIQARSTFTSRRGSRPRRTAGGKIIGFGNRHDRHQRQLRPARLHGPTAAGCSSGSTRLRRDHRAPAPATTTASGTTWSARCGRRGMKLYVDGELVGPARRRPRRARTTTATGASAATPPGPAPSPWFNGTHRRGRGLPDARCRRTQVSRPLRRRQHRRPSTCRRRRRSPRRRRTSTASFDGSRLERPRRLDRVVRVGLR